MSFFIFSRRAASVTTLLALLLAPACTTPPSADTTAAPQSAPAAPPPLAAIDYSTPQDSVVGLDREIAAAGQDTTKLRAIASRLIPLLQEPGTTAAARQAIAERLGVFPEAILTTAANARLFAAMLADEKQVNFARLALDRVPGATVDRLFIDALKSSAPNARLAVVQSIARRRTAAAVPQLTPLLKDPDVRIVAATIHALGNIGTKDALSAVAAAPAPNSNRVIEAALAIAHQIGGSEATRTFQSVSENQSIAPHLRAAGFRGLLFAEPAKAPSRLVAALSGSDQELKPVVIEAIASHPSNDIVSALAGQLATWDAPTQAAVLAALGRKGDVAALSAAATSTRHEDDRVRAAAITALGHLPGSSEIALLLARIAAGENAEDARLARQSLSRLNGPGVAETVLAQATNGEQPIRVVFLEQLASRNVSTSIPLLLQTRNDPVPAVRSAALGALAEIGTPSEQRAILDWAIAATDVTEQSRALRALSNVTLRNPEVATRSKAITQAIEDAPSAVAVRLLPVLSRISGAASAESAARLALRDDVTLSNAAINTLSRWPDREGLSPLVSVAEKATDETARAAAVKAAIAYLERNRDLPSADLVRVITRLLPRTQEPETKTRLVYLLGRSSTPEALALAEKLKSEADLSAVATDIAAIIRASSEGTPVVRASGNEKQVGNIVDGRMTTRWTVPARSDQWIEIDYKLKRPFRQIVLDNNGAPWGAPESFAVYVTDDPKNPGEARVTGSGQTGKTTIDLPAGSRGQYLIIRHTADADDSVWSISEVFVD